MSPEDELFSSLYDQRAEDLLASDVSELAEADPWLISYADLMTLLFGFFAMLFTYASLEDTSAIKINANTARYFGGSYVAPFDKVASDFKFIIGNSPYKNDVDLKVGEEGLEVSFITSVLFHSGNAVLLPNSTGPLDILGKLILSAEKDSTIRVEGHTDDNPISNSVYPSNWELSAARAATVARFFEKLGLPADRLSIAGYGSSRPAYPNRDEKGVPLMLNQAHNRRVVVKVILPKGEKKNLKMESEVAGLPLSQK